MCGEGGYFIAKGIPIKVKPIVNTVQEVRDSITLFPTIADSEKT
jgi:hypothetical protein